MKQFILLIIILNTFVTFAQKEANQWYIERGNAIDFNGDSALFLDGCVLGNNESSSNICDKNGQMLFYSNGITLYNRFHKIVKNGMDLGFPINSNETTSGDGTLIVKHPDNDSFLYLFSSDYQGRSGGFVYAIISIYGNKDSGEVISKKNTLVSRINEPIISINHQNGRDIWVCVHGYGNSLFHLFLIKKSGIVDCSTEQIVGFEHSNDAQKIMKVSPDGNYIAQSDANKSYFELLNLSNENVLFKSIYWGFSHYWNFFEFSPNSNYIYYGDYNIQQFNIKTKQKIQVSNFSFDVFPAKLQIGIDGKIYGAVYDSKDLIVIENPNEEGLNCKVTVKKDFFKNTVRTSLPNFNQSYFYTPSINYSYEMNCTKNSIQFWGKDTFGAVSHVWQVKKLTIGNWQLAGSNKNINYSFTDTGDYEVRYIASNGNRSDTVTKTITLYDKINPSFLGKDTVFAEGDVINKTLFAPVPNHCVKWQDSSSLNNYLVTSKGTYICKVTNAAFCEVWDTITISTCINNLNQPSLFRSRDTLKTWHLNADSFVWYRNNQLYKITKQPFLKLTDTGTYRVEAAKKDHCNSKSIGQLMVNKLSVNGISIEDLGIRVFPNPSNGVVSIQSQNSFKLKINTVLGQVVYEGENINNIQLPKGIYFLHFEVEGYKVVEKVVVW